MMKTKAQVEKIIRIKQIAEEALRAQAVAIDLDYKLHPVNGPRAYELSAEEMRMLGAKHYHTEVLFTKLGSLVERYNRSYPHSRLVVGTDGDFRPAVIVRHDDNTTETFPLNI